ncbi:MAG: hypothetical protein AAGF58_08450 [Pseudomonadota bacterium]
MTKSHRYPLSWVAADYARALFGLALTAGPLLFIGPALVFALVLGVLALVFAVFLVRTWMRHKTVYAEDDRGLSEMGPPPFGGSARIDWADLAAVSLRYYSTQRNREGGWMQLTLKNSNGSAVRLESPLPGFSSIAERAFAASKINNVTLDETTVANARAAGYRLPGETKNESNAGL